MNNRLMHLNQKFLKPTYIYMSAEGPNLRAVVMTKENQINEAAKKEKKDGDSKGVDPERIGDITNEALKDVTTVENMENKIVNRIAKSPVASAYKEDLKRQISDLKSSNVGNIARIKVEQSKTAQERLFKTLDAVRKEVSAFEEKSDVSALLKFGEKKDAVAPIINLETFSADHTQDITKLLVNALGTENNKDIVNIQGAFGLQQTGEIDIPTLKVIGQVIGLRIDPKLGDETILAGGERFKGEKEKREEKKAEGVKAVEAKIGALKLVLKKGPYAKYGKDEVFKNQVNFLIDELKRERDNIKNGKPGNAQYRVVDVDPKKWANDQVGRMNYKGAI